MTRSLRLRIARSSMLAAATLLGSSARVGADPICPVTTIASGLVAPMGVTQSNLGNLIVAETGTATARTGRLSIVGKDGTRRTLLWGLPTGVADVGDPSGPSGVFMQGRTLYVAIMVGDVGLAGGAPGAVLPNPTPSSPIFSSVLAVRFSANVERTVTNGYELTLADQYALASGERLTFGRGADAVTIELVADFENYIPSFHPTVPNNVRISNPFGVVAVDDQLFVTDGGRNLVWQVDIPTGAISILATFPAIANPIFPFGGPFIEAVPTGITYAAEHLLVTLFRGFPFLAGTSVVERIDPETGAHAPLLTGFKTAIAVAPQGADYLVLHHTSGGPGPFPTAGPGGLLRVTPGSAPSVIADCLSRPTSMAVDGKTGLVYVNELTPRLVAPVATSAIASVVERVDDSQFREAREVTVRGHQFRDAGSRHNAAMWACARGCRLRQTLSDGVEHSA